nr:reverse transcriptase domain-containing protein [Tanacetum cinerariifolium]
MADTRTMSKLLQEPTEGYGDAIVIPAILVEDFELKVGLLQLVTSSQFYGFERDDPHAHIPWFNKITYMLKYKNVPNDAIKLMIFPFSLKGAARTWLEKEPCRSIHTWEDLVSKFVNYFFPPSKTTNLKNEIMNFQQKFEETFSEAWDRFKDLLRKWPHHGFSKLHQIDTFYNSLTQSNQDSLNAAAGGNLLNCTPRDALTIIKNKSKVGTLRNKPVVSKVNTTTSSSSPSPDITALTDIVKELVLMNKANQQAFVKAIEETCNKLKVRTSLNKPVVLKVNTTTSSSSPSPDITALTDIVKELVLMNKANQQASVKAIEETCVTCGGPHPYYECLATDSNTFNASVTTGSYNQGGLESCMALADLGASINLMPLSMWKKLYLLDLTSTRMTLELATRSFAYPVGIAEDVFVQVGKFIFPVDFVVVYYDVDLHVPLILGRPFLRTARALVDVHGEELILRNGDEQLIFHADSTSKHPHKHGNESINMINFIDFTCEDHFPEVLKFTKSNHRSSGSTTPLSDSSPSRTPFETSDFLLEEFADELALFDPIPPGKEDNNFDFEADLREIEFLLHQDPSTESKIEIIDPISRSSLTNLLSITHLHQEMTMMIFLTLNKNENSKKKLFVEAHIVESNDLLPQLLTSDSTLPEESSESFGIVTLSSSPFRNKDKYGSGSLTLRTMLSSSMGVSFDLILLASALPSRNPILP